MVSNLVQVFTVEFANSKKVNNKAHKENINLDKTTRRKEFQRSLQIAQDSISSKSSYSSQKNKKQENTKIEEKDPAIDYEKKKRNERKVGHSLINYYGLVDQPLDAQQWDMDPDHNLLNAVSNSQDLNPITGQVNDSSSIHNEIQLSGLAQADELQGALKNEPRFYTGEDGCEHLESTHTDLYLPTNEGISANMTDTKGQIDLQELMDTDNKLIQQYLNDDENLLGKEDLVSSEGQADLKALINKRDGPLKAVEFDISKQNLNDDENLLGKEDLVSSEGQADLKALINKRDGPSKAVEFDISKQMSLDKDLSSIEGPSSKGLSKSEGEGYLQRILGYNGETDNKGARPAITQDGQEQFFAPEEESKKLEQTQENDMAITNGELLQDKSLDFSKVLLKQNPIEQAQLIDQLADRAIMALGQDNSELEVQIRPKDLGKLILKVAIEDGVFIGKIYTSNEEVRDFLQNNMEELRTILKDQGFIFTSLDVDLGNQSSPDGFQYLAQAKARPGKTSTINVTGMEIRENKPTLMASSSQVDYLA